MPQMLSQDVRLLKGVGDRRAAQFAKLGIHTLDALLRHYPRGYIDMTHPAPIGEAPLGEPAAVRAAVYSKDAPVRVRGGKTVIKVHCGDGATDLTLTYFNNKYAPAALKVGEEYLFYGKLAGGLLAREMVNPLVLRPENTAALSPQYPLTEGLPNRVVEHCVREAYRLCRDELEETLPGALAARCGLVSRREAIHDIHFPADYARAAAAKKRLIFEELFILSLGMRRLRARARSETAVRLDRGDLDAFTRSLPYALTGAQARCIAEIAAGCAAATPMNRLLQGDVGSGKTVCAAAGAFLAAQSGYQSAVMAPTEILAEQHAQTFSKLLAPFGVTVGLLTGSVKGAARKTLLAQIADGSCGLVVGTHAVLGEAVQFARLGFVVADEQHRFGVAQRALLAQKGSRPHLLVMSATPIPRTLALIIYGDLDLSVLDELPPGRQPVRTLLVPPSYRARYLGFVRKTVERGGQAYIVCPLVEEGEGAAGELRSAREYKAALEQNELRGLSVGLVHGRMRPAEKTAVMAAFKRGEIQVLVSTTVIEVGVDVPNATLMIIENAERFGLSALHQLRGRVGRGGGESFCVLVSDAQNERSRSRLKVMTQTNDGFEIARQDLKARGPGDFFGHRQHGLPELHVADLAGDDAVLYQAAGEADALLAADPELTQPAHRVLAQAVERMFADSDAALN